MIDAYILLAPFLLLGVMALLAFVGCNQVFGLHETVLSVDVSGVQPTSGTPAGGTPVTIFGSGFEGNGAHGVAVSFGGIAPLDVQLVSDSEITATTPMHPAGLVDVTVTRSDGVGATKGGAYTFSAVTHVVTVPQNAGVAVLSLSAALNYSQPRLVIATVLWGGTASVNLTGAQFNQVELDTLTPQRVAVFAANNITGPLTVTAALSQASSTRWNLIVSVYDFASPTSAPDSPMQTQGNGTSLVLPFPTSSLSAGDLVYSVAVTRTSGSVLAGMLAAGAPFTAEAVDNYVMVQDYVLTPVDIAAGQISITAANNDPAATATSKWYLFGMRVPHS